MKKWTGCLSLLACFCLLAGCSAEEGVPVEAAVSSTVPLTSETVASSSVESLTTATSVISTTVISTTIISTTVPTTTVPTSPPTTAPAPSKEPTLEERIDRICEKHHVTGMSMAVFQGEEIVYSRSYGYADKAAGILAGKDTKYRIASISKLVTGMAVMRLQDEGLIQLDEDVSDYLGVTLRSPSYPDIPITIRMLMQHTSGIIDSKAYSASSGNPPYRTLQELIDAGGMFTSSKPGTRYRYTNFGAGLMAGVIEGATGERFYEYMQHAVMEPLNIDGGYIHTKIQNHDQVANMYRNGRLSYDLKNSQRREGAYDNLPLGSMYLLGHGDLIISANDLAKFGMILAGDGTYHGFRFLSQESVNAMNDSYFRSGKNWVGLSQANTNTLVEGRNLHGHTGSAYGMISAMFFDPSDHTGAVFITNGADKIHDAQGNYTMASDLFRLVYSEIL